MIMHLNTVEIEAIVNSHPLTYVHNNLQGQLSSLWRKMYLLNLRKHHSTRQPHTKKLEIAEGDVVILKDNNTRDRSGN